MAGNTIRINYNLTDEAVDAYFIEHGEMPGTLTVEFNPKTLGKAQRKTLAELGVYNSSEHLNVYEVDERGNFSKAQTKRYDHELTVPEAIQELKKNRAEEKKALALQRKRVDAWDKKHEEERKAEEKRKAEEEARRQAEIEKELKERETWIAEHGSDHLKRACAAGHDCSRLYLTERAANEYPDAILDYNEHADYSSRSCPSIAALDLRDKLLKEHPNAQVEIVWVTAEPINEVGFSKYDQGEREMEFESYEAVMVTDPNFGDDNKLFFEIK